MVCFFLFPSFLIRIYPSLWDIIYYLCNESADNNHIYIQTNQSNNNETTYYILADMPADYGHGSMG